MDNIEREHKLTAEQVDPRYATVSIATKGEADEQKTYTGQMVVALILHPTDESGEPQPDGIQQMLVGHTSMRERAEMAHALRNLADQLMPKNPLMELLEALTREHAEEHPVIDATAGGLQ